MTGDRFADLTPETYQEWLAAHRARDGLWVFQHIPKTAGSSLANEIAAQRPPYRNIHIANQSKLLRPPIRMKAALATFLHDSRKEAFRSASGHLRADHIADIRHRYPDARILTYLRDPFSRILSDYRYARTPAHPTWQKMRKDFPDFDAYLKVEPMHNKMAAFMFGRADLPPDEAVEIAFQTFSFIGLQERYAQSFALLSSLLWEASAPALRKRVTPDLDENRVEINDTHRQIVAEKNRLDQALVDAVEAKLASLEDQVALTAG